MQISCEEIFQMNWFFENQIVHQMTILKHCVTHPPPVICRNIMRGAGRGGVYECQYKYLYGKVKFILFQTITFRIRQKTLFSILFKYTNSAADPRPHQEE